MGAAARTSLLAIGVLQGGTPGAMRRTFGIVTTGFNIGGTFGPLAYGWLMDNNLPRAVFVGPSERRRRGSGRLRGSRRAS
jgi:hypothetical protein